MGQLEKYGLYVLCLVIFLILGVAIWGEPEVALADRSGNASATPVAAARAAADVDLNALMSPVPPPRGNGRQAARDGHDDGSLPIGPDPGKGDDGKAEAGGAHGNAGKPADKAGENGDKNEPAPQRRSHTVRAGETFESIARQELGDVRFVPLLRQLNPKVQPERLQLGKALVLPAAAELAGVGGGEPAAAGKGAAAKDAGAAKADQADASPAGTYRIQRGDTLEGLAKRLYGKDYVHRVNDIKKLNPTVDPTRLRIGQLIRLPAR